MDEYCPDFKMDSCQHFKDRWGECFNGSMTCRACFDEHGCDDCVNSEFCLTEEGSDSDGDA